MRDYEIVYIFRSSFTPEEIEAKLERYHGILTEGSGEITAVEHWGKRQLAYPIRKQTSGSYVVAQFTAEPEPLAELERVLKLEDDLLRYLVVLSEGELPIPESMREREAEGPETRGEAESVTPEADDEADEEAEAEETEEAEAEETEEAEAEEAEAEEAEAHEAETEEAEAEEAEAEEAEAEEAEEGEAEAEGESEDDDASGDAEEKGE